MDRFRRSSNATGTSTLSMFEALLFDLYIKVSIEDSSPSTIAAGFRPVFLRLGGRTEGPGFAMLSRGTSRFV